MPVRLSDVILPEATAREIRALIRIMNDPQAAAAIGASLPPGAILYGPPGTGKTLIARAIAGETGRAVLAYTASELTSVWVGEAAQLIRMMFLRARAEAPCVLFIDEIDGLAPARSSGSAHATAADSDARARLAEFLHAIEGVHGTLAEVFIVGATNRLEDVDPAVASRLSYHVQVHLPDERAREAILKFHFPRSTATPAEVARLTQGLSGRDLRDLCRAASIAALADGAGAVTLAHFERALARIGSAPAARATRRAEPTRMAPATLDDVVLPAPLKAELATLIRLVADPDAASRYVPGAPLGAILHGPPGTGKTLIARAIAGEARRPVIAFAGASITSMWVGEGTQLVRDMFAQARAQAPCVLVIDEIDGITPSRASLAGSAGSWDDAVQRINQFLQEIEGVAGQPSGVFVIGITNRIDAVDEAVRSRLAYHVEIPLPDAEAREAILRLHWPQLASCDPREVAALAEGLSGRGLRELCRIAGLVAFSERAPAITIDHFRRALQRVRADAGGS